MGTAWGTPATSGNSLADVAASGISSHPTIVVSSSVPSGATTLNRTVQLVPTRHHPLGVAPKGDPLALFEVDLGQEAIYRSATSRRAATSRG